MNFPELWMALPGSQRHPAPGTTEIGILEPAQTLRVRVYVRPQSEAGPEVRSACCTGERSPGRYWASREDLEAVAQFANQNDLEVISLDASSRWICLSGTVASLSRAFGVRLSRWRNDRGEFRGRSGPILVPVELQGIVRSVLGLDSRRLCRYENLSEKDALVGNSRFQSVRMPRRSGMRA